MSILTSGAKWVLGSIYSKIEAADAEPRAAQAAVHSRLSETLRGKRVVETQDPRIFDSLESYRRFVRPTRHEDVEAFVSEAMRRPCANVFETGVTTAFGHTSSGKKYVPFTRAHVASFQRFSAAAMAQAVHGLGLPQLLEERTLMIQSSLEVNRVSSGAVAGYSSGVMLERTPWLVRRRLLPSPEALRAARLSDRIGAIETALLERRPRALTGIPEHVVGVLRTLLEGPRGRQVAEALKRIEVYAWSGTTLGPNRRFLQETLSSRARFVDAVSATEGPLGICASSAGSYRLALNDGLFLFVDDQDPSDRRFAHELVAGRRYEVWLGSFAGLVGYRTGDRIEVQSTQPVRFRLLPRHFDVDHAWETLGSEVTDFCVYRPKDGADAKVLLESRERPTAASAAAFSKLLGTQATEFKLMVEGALSKAALEATLSGLVKRPWFHERPEVHALLGAGA